MGITKAPDPVNYAAHIFTAGDSDYWLYEKGLKEQLEKRIGKIDYISGPLDFQKYTFFYNEEMGENIKINARIISFQELRPQYYLADAKIITNQIEEVFSYEGKRKVNIDIGFVHHTQFVLASTKHWGNRIYIRRGIYAEITLMYVYGKWTALEYSYENFKGQEYQQEIQKVRELYMQKRKNGNEK